MQIVFNIDPEQIIEAAAKMSIDEKLRLYEKIKDEVLQIRFEQLRNELKETVSISDEEIAQEVEYVREQNFKNHN